MLGGGTSGGAEGANACCSAMACSLENLSIWARDIGDGSASNIYFISGFSGGSQRVIFLFYFFLVLFFWFIFFLIVAFPHFFLLRAGVVLAAHALLDGVRLLDRLQPHGVERALPHVALLVFLVGARLPRELHAAALVVQVLAHEDLRELQAHIRRQGADVEERLHVLHRLDLEARHGQQDELHVVLLVDALVRAEEQLLQVAADVRHLGGEDPTRGDRLAHRLVPAVAGRDHLLGDARDRPDVALELVQQELEVLAGGEHGLLRHGVIARQREDVGLVRGDTLELLADLGVARPQVRRVQRREGGDAQLHHGLEVGVVREVHQRGAGVLLFFFGGVGGLDAFKHKKKYIYKNAT